MNIFDVNHLFMFGNKMSLYDKSEEYIRYGNNLYNLTIKFSICESEHCFDKRCFFAKCDRFPEF